MSDIINLLPDSIANQIAAGEVITRPASVVKELVENSIDAGATKIIIVIKQAGRTLIQVTDNGKGMSHTDARMAFERHATSKIKRAEDLYALDTMGFRGEALPSIASVSRVEVFTKQQGEDIGTSIVIEGSEVIKHELTSCEEGTTFLVKNLFFNIPVRRKFLKTETTELKHIIYEFQRLALANPIIEFSLYDDKDIIFETTSGNFKQRIVSIFGKKTKNYSSNLVSIGADTNMVKISGFVGTPQSAMKNATQFFFVNGRFMRHPYFNKAVNIAYENMLQSDTQPIYFINLQVPTDTIDVNVHPTKTEIKFEDERDIFMVLMACVRESLGKFNIVPSLEFDQQNTTEIPPYRQGHTTQHPKIEIDTTYNPFANNSFRSHRSTAPRNWEALYKQNRDSLPASNTISKPNTSLNDTEPIEQKSFLIHKNRYIVTSVKSGLMIVDRQKAMERIAYEKIIVQMESEHKPTQKILFPKEIELMADEAITFIEIQDDLKAMGFEFELSDNNTYQITGIPPMLLSIPDTSKLLHDIIAYLSDSDNIEKEVYKKIAIQTAKNYASCSSQPLNEEETEQLLASLFQCNSPKITPSGARIISIIDDNDIWRGDR